ncbi:MAG: DNA-processing protein DprA [Salibacteraceae bacterium]
MKDLRLYQIALKHLEGIGSLRAKKLVAYTGGLEELFNASKKELAKTPEIGMALINKLDRPQALKKAEKELKFIDRNHLEAFFYLDHTYPYRLMHCGDSPVILYGKGVFNLNPSKSVAIVGTRDCSDYGLKITERLVEALAPYKPLIVSGLAYGIDTCAHRSAVQYGLQTVGVLGNSLDRVYPAVNRSLADKMMQNGGLLSEFDSGTKPDRENFPQRNRVVAGMADVTIVVESGVKGGSLITARLAAGYNRDVMAIPGPIDSPVSSGCNYLIKTNQAALIESVDDIAYNMGWDREEEQRSTQKQLFVDLNEEERVIVNALEEKQKDSVDNLSLACGWPISKTSTMLLELEFKGMVRSLPGKIYALA